MTSTPYPQYLSPSGWNALLPPRIDIRTLPGDAKAEIAVVGAGYTGIAIARQWATHRRHDRIVLLEASRVGEGNPGRNSGFLLEIALANDADASAIGRMHECNALISRTMNRLRDAVYDRGISCDIEHAGTYRAAAGEVGRKALRQYQRFLEAAGLPHERLEFAQLRERLGTGYYRVGLYSPHCYLVQPAALVRGLAELLPESADLYEDTPALGLKRDRGYWQIDTPSGHVTAERVFIANNAFAKSLGFAASRVVAMYTYAGLTAPLPEDAELGSESTWGLLPTHRLGCTLRRTRDNRLLIRSHYGYESETNNDRIGATLLTSLKRRYPALDVDGFESVWGGATGFTMNGAPVWGELVPGLYISAGCNGGGVVKGTLFGELLADLALGEDVPDVRRLFGHASWMPPEPIRRMGFEIISRLERRQGQAEM